MYLGAHELNEPLLSRGFYSMNMRCEHDPDVRYIAEKVNMVENTLAVNFSFAKVNYTRVNLFQNCYDEVASCTIRRHSDIQYWHLCSTPYRRINITVS